MLIHSLTISDRVTKQMDSTKSSLVNLYYASMLENLTEVVGRVYNFKGYEIQVPLPILFICVVGFNGLFHCLFSLVFAPFYLNDETSFVALCQPHTIVLSAWQRMAALKTDPASLESDFQISICRCVSTSEKTTVKVLYTQRTFRISHSFAIWHLQLVEMPFK